MNFINKSTFEQKVNHSRDLAVCARIGLDFLTRAILVKLLIKHFKTNKYNTVFMPTINSLIWWFKIRQYMT